MEEEQKKQKEQKIGGLEVTPDKVDNDNNSINSGKVVKIFINFESAINEGGGGSDPGTKPGGGSGDPGTKGGGGSGEIDSKNCKTVNIFINFESATNTGGSGTPGTKADGSEAKGNKDIKDKEEDLKPE